MERRNESRLSIDLPGSYVRSGRSQAMFFSQISSKGCRLTAEALDVRVGEAICLHLGPVGPIDAIVRWVRDGRAGVEFDMALDAAVVAYFAAFIDAAA